MREWSEDNSQSMPLHRQTMKALHVKTGSLAHVPNARRIIAALSRSEAGLGNSPEQAAVDYLRLPGLKNFQRQLYLRFADVITKPVCEREEPSIVVRDNPADSVTLPVDERAFDDKTGPASRRAFWVRPR